MKTRLALLLGITLAWSACSSPGPDNDPPTLPPPQQLTATPFRPDPTATTVRSTPTASPEPTATTPPQGYGPDNFPANVSPLTGQPVADTSLLERRPLAVKVALIPRSSRPQWGLTLADHVYEFYQNGGISRLHAIFYSQDAERVGPIRSARFFDSTLIRMYRSIFAFGSADARVLGRFSFAEFFPYLVSEYPAACGPMCRIEPGGLNHLVTNTQDLSEYISGQGLSNTRQNLDGLRFNSLVPASGQPATQVFARFGPQVYHRWDYDPARGRYLRFQDTRDDLSGAGEDYAPMMDQLKDVQVAADNVVVLIVPHEYLSRSNPELVEIYLEGSGRAYAFRDGQMFEVTWQLPGPNSMLSFQAADGSPYVFKPGNIWFSVQGLNSVVTNPAANAWRFEFRIP